MNHSRYVKLLCQNIRLLQIKVIEHLETERLFLTNSRSKAGFLVSACEKAKRGELDARGFGALDPWRTQLKAECFPRPVISLSSEAEWVSKHDGKTSVSLTILQDGVNSTSFSFGWNVQISSIEDQIYGAISPPPAFKRPRLKLSHPIYGSLRGERTPAFYNLSDGDCLQVKIKLRGGRKVNRQL